LGGRGQGSGGAWGKHLADTQRAQGPEVGPVGDAVRREAVITAMPGQECDPPPGHVTDNDRVAGRAERGLNLDLLAGSEQLVEARPADNSDVRLAGHRLRPPSSRFRNRCRPSRSSSLAWHRRSLTCPPTMIPNRPPSTRPWRLTRHPSRSADCPCSWLLA